MIYFMTAFFLALNNANWIWWGMFCSVIIIELFILIMKLDIALGKK
jgi:hypothetical protein